MQKVNIAFVSKPENLERVRKALGQSRLIGVDTETLGLDARTKEIRTLQVSTALETFVIDLRATGFDNTREALLDVLLDRSKVKIFQNAKFDLQFLHLYLGFPLSLPSLFDTQIASALINGGAREDNGAPVSHSLASIAKRYLNFDMEKKYQKVSWDGSLYQEQLIYAGLDSHILIPLYQLMSKNIKLNQLEKAAKLEFDCIEATAHIELSGIRLDKAKWLEASRMFSEQNVILEDELREVLGYSVNFNSPKQVQEVFRDRLGVSVESLNKDYLKGFCDEYEPKADMFGAMPPVDPRDVITKYSLWKKNDKASGIYGADFFKHINPKTGRIHSSFKQLETDTARYSSTAPNVQNLPSKAVYRNAFVPDEGNKFAIFDYSQVELRILADAAGIKKWIAAFKNGDDLHTINAMGAFGLTEAEVTKEYRSRAKCVAEGTLILTNEGEIPIEDITNRHLLWDGVDWVAHEGLIYKGIKEVIEYDGLKATPDHVVYTEEGFTVPIGYLASQMERQKIAVTASNGIPIVYRRHTQVCRKGQRWLENFNKMRGVSDGERNKYRQSSAGQEQELSMSEEKERPTRLLLRRSLRKYGATLHQKYKSFLQKLRSKRDKSFIQKSKRFYQLLQIQISSSNKGMRSANRPYRQQWTLREGQHSFRNSARKCQEHTSLYSESMERSTVSYETASNRSDSIYLSEHKDLERNSTEKSGEGKLELPQDRELQSTVKSFQRVFDILNAGSRHRFTANGKLVSNCIGFGSAFGMMAAGYMRRVNLMSDRKISKAEAERDMKGYYKAIPEFTVWLNSQVEYFKQYNLVRSGSGRMRVLDRWAMNEQELHLAKQASRNFPIQSTAADILKTALVSFMKAKDADTRIVNIVHDEVVIEASEEDIKDEAAKLKFCMEEAGREYVHSVEITVDGKVSVDKWEK